MLKDRKNIDKKQLLNNRDKYLHKQSQIVKKLFTIVTKNL